MIAPEVFRCIPVSLKLTTLAVASTACQAAVVLDNLGYDGSASNTQVWDNYRHAVSITTSGTALTVNSVAFNLYIWPSGNPGSTQVAFFNDNSGSPGAQFGATFTNPTFTPNTSGTHTFTPSSALTLAANTTYWVRLFNPTDLNQAEPQSLNIYFGPSVTPTVSGITAGSYRISGVSEVWSTVSSVYPSIQVVATTVPEPAATATVTSLAMALAIFVRSRKSSTRQA